MRRNSTRTRGNLCLPALLTLGFLWAGCGDDSSPAGPGVPTEQRVQEGTAQLGDFVDNASSTTGAQLLDSPTFQTLLESLGVPSVAFSLPEPPGASPSVRRFLSKLGRSERHSIVQADFGTYAMDPQNVLGPFPGWTLVDPNNPPDGFVFRFGLDDGISAYDETGMLVALRGEFRFVDLEIDDAGTPGDPTDDFLSGLVIEIAATPDPQGSLPVLVRFELHATFDVTGELTSLVLGDPQAQDSGDAGASFIGPVLLAVQVQTGLTTTDMLLQVYDSLEDFVVRLDLNVVEELGTGLTEAASLEFSWGVTSRPTSPPWTIALLLDNFRIEDPVNGGEIADVSGSIAHRNIPLATLAGDTSEVPVDLDGDEVPDINCMNVMVTFADTPEEPQSLCEALPVLQELFGNGIPKLVPLGGGWR